MIISHLESAAIKLIKDKFSIHTKIVDTEEAMELWVYSVYDGKIIHSHKQDLDPLYRAFKDRLTKDLKI